MKAIKQLTIRISRMMNKAYNRRILKKLNKLPESREQRAEFIRTKQQEQILDI